MLWVESKSDLNLILETRIEWCNHNLFLVQNLVSLIKNCVYNNISNLYLENYFQHGLVPFVFRYFQSGGNPVQVIEQLSDNYTAVAQMANLIAKWLIIGGMQHKKKTLVKFILM